MKLVNRLALVVLLASLTVVSFAQSVTGTWHGKFSIDLSSIPKAKNPTDAQAQRTRVDQITRALAQAKITLTINANNTFKFVGENVPGSKGTQTSEGTCTRSGSTLTFVSKKENGKPATPQEAKPQNLAIGDGGHKLTLLLPNTGQVKISIIFSR